MVEKTMQIKRLKTKGNDTINVKRKVFNKIKEDAIEVKQLVEEERKRVIPINSFYQFFKLLLTWLKELLTCYVVLLIPPLGWSGTHHYLEGDYSLAVIYSITFGIGGLAYLLDFFFIYFSRSGNFWFFIRYIFYPGLLQVLINLVSVRLELPWSIENTIIASMFVMNQVTWLTSVLLATILYIFPQVLLISLPMKLLFISVIDWRVSAAFKKVEFPMRYFNDFNVKYTALGCIVISIVFYTSLMVQGEESGINELFKKYIIHIKPAVPKW